MKLILLGLIIYLLFFHRRRERVGETQNSPDGGPALLPERDVTPPVALSRGEQL